MQIETKGSLCVCKNIHQYMHHPTYRQITSFTQRCFRGKEGRKFIELLMKVKRRVKKLA